MKCQGEESWRCLYLRVWNPGEAMNHSEETQGQGRKAWRNSEVMKTGQGAHKRSGRTELRERNALNCIQPKTGCPKTRIPQTKSSINELLIVLLFTAWGRLHRKHLLKDLVWWALFFTAWGSKSILLINFLCTLPSSYKWVSQPLWSEGNNKKSDSLRLQHIGHPNKTQLWRTLATSCDGTSTE